MYWFKWLQFFNTEKDTVKTKHLLVQSHTSHSDTKLKILKLEKQFIFNFVKYLNNYIYYVV